MSKKLFVTVKMRAEDRDRLLEIAEIERRSLCEQMGFLIDHYLTQQQKESA